MVERVIENWLGKSTEKSFQLPFCYMMADRGFSIYHLTRHGPQELGKDVIVVSPDGEVCAFQLKGGSTRRITIGKWQDDIFPQVLTMANTPVDHPSKYGASPPFLTF